MTRAQHVKSFHLINSVAATVSPAEAQRLAANPAVAAIVPDETLHAAGTPSALGTAAAPRAATAHGITPPPGVCAPPGQVQLNPEAIINIHAATQDGTGPSAQSLGYTGAGVKVAFIAGGIDVNNPEFIRPNGQHVFVDFQDFSNTGSNTEGDALESFIDAGSIAAQGSRTYDLSGWGQRHLQPSLPDPRARQLRRARASSASTSRRRRHLGQLVDSRGNRLRGHRRSRRRAERVLRIRAVPDGSEHRPDEDGERRGRGRGCDRDGGVRGRGEFEHHRLAWVPTRR